MEPKIFWSAYGGKGRHVAYINKTLILMGDWCGEENCRHDPREIPAEVKSRR